MKVLDYVRREPVRVYMYGVFAAAIGLLIGYGIITTAMAPLWLGLVIAALALKSPVEAVRDKVTPVEQVEEVNYDYLPIEEVNNEG